VRDDGRARRRPRDGRARGRHVRLLLRRLPHRVRGGPRPLRASAAALTVRLEDLPGLVGRDLGPTDWHEVTQDEIDAFAKATGDRQWIHVNRERAAAGPFGRPIAHGLLTLSLAVALLDELLEVEDAALVVNYGLNRVRFPAPVPVGANVRLRGTVTSTEPVEGGVQAVLALTIELDGAAKPACAAELVLRFLR
jgi:acyl dehydratase